MAQPSMNKLHPIFLEQGEYLAKRDVTGLMTLYHPDAEFIRFQGIARGRDEIRKIMEKYVELDLEFEALIEYVEGDDVIMMRSRMRVNGDPEVSNAILVLRDGKIWRQAAMREGGSRDWGF